MQETLMDIWHLFHSYTFKDVLFLWIFSENNYLRLILVIKLRKQCQVVLTALTCMNFFLYKQKMLFYQEDVYFGHIVVWTIYTSLIDHFTPQHTALEKSTACLSVFLESIPGLIPFAILWHAGWTLEKTSCMNMNYNYRTTIIRSIFAQNVHISGRKYIFTFFTCELFKVKMKKKVNNTRNTLYLGQTTSKYRSQIIVVYVLANGFL